jgi:hypothetical protein
VPRNARFWSWQDGGWVKLTLRPGESLSHHTYRVTDEGYSARSSTWTHTGGCVELACEDSGRDCDGTVESWREMACPLADLGARFGHDGTPIPEWQETSARQRDHSAEAMGY